MAKDSLTFDVTLNPDFSQVESDDPQVTINQRFAVLFPEKRPFFIENAGFFQTPVDLFFSRQIADPQFNPTRGVTLVSRTPNTSRVSKPELLGDAVLLAAEVDGEHFCAFAQEYVDAG